MEGNKTSKQKGIEERGERREERGEMRERGRNDGVERGEREE